MQKLETYDTEGLIVIQVAQLEKEKKELNERLRIVAKRVDHIERAYRKDERPLVALDYERQQRNDRETFNAVQKARKEQAKITHQEDVTTKSRLARMMDDYKARRDVIIAKKGEEFEKRSQAAQRKIEEEKAKRRNAFIKAMEEEKEHAERQERERQEREAEEMRLEEGMYRCFAIISFRLTGSRYHQSVLPKRSGALQKRKRLQQLLSKPNVRPRRRQLRHGRNVRRTVQLPLKGHACNNREKMRLQRAAQHALQRSWHLFGNPSSLHHPLQYAPTVGEILGDAPLRLPPLCLLHPVAPPQTMLRPHVRRAPALLSPSTGQEPLEVEDGVQGRMPRRMLEVLQLWYHLVPWAQLLLDQAPPLLSLLRRKKRLQRTTKASRLWHQRGREGASGARAGDVVFSCCIPCIAFMIL